MIGYQFWIDINAARLWLCNSVDKLKSQRRKQATQVSDKKKKREASIFARAFV